MIKPSEIRMADIARMAGVSEATVSRALADSPLIAAKTRERIREIARNSNYSINESARNFRKKESRIIEVVIPIDSYDRPHISDPFFLDMLGSIADAASDQDYDILLSKTSPWSEGKRANALGKGRADGMIIIGQGKTQTGLRDFARRHANVVVWGGALPGDDYLTVGSDNVAGGFDAVSHLIRLGRRKIAFMGDRDQPEIALRYQGYEQALRQAGLRPTPEMIIPSQFDSELALEAMSEFLRKNIAHDALFAASDVIAMSAIHALRNYGKTVPGDVAVVGYDNILSAAWFSPALSTVSQDIANGGRALVGCLLAKMRGEQSSSVLLPTQLMIRRSCGG